MPENCLIYILRHGQTELSEKKRLIGQCDVRLNGQGVENAKKLGQRLANCGIKNIFCSELSRTRVMAEIIGEELGYDPCVVAGLNEISLGDWDGIFIDDIMAGYPEQYAQRGQKMIDFRPPGGENFWDLQKRVLNAFEKICKMPGNMLIAGHRSVNRIILANILGMPLPNIFRIVQNYNCCNVISQTANVFCVNLINGEL